MSIYDRAKWPRPESNPLVLMLRRDDEWFSNTEIQAALGRSGSRRSLISQWPTLAAQLGADETAIQGRQFLTSGAERHGRGGGVERLFSRKAVVLIAMRAQTVNAAAFCDWLAADVRPVAP